MNLLGLIYIPDWIALIAILVTLVYLYSTWTYTTWERRGIKSTKPVPLFGDLWGAFKAGIHASDFELVKKNGKFFGVYEGRVPTLMISDPDILKEIMVKDGLSNFSNRRDLFQSIFDDLLAQAFPVKLDEEWKAERSIITPTFTSNKIKKMVYLINEASEILLTRMGQLADKKEEFETKSLFGAFTLDIVASTMFGIQIDSQSNPDSEFVKHAKVAFSAQLSSPMFVAHFFFPFLKPLLKFMNITFVPHSCMEFFRETVSQILEKRRNGESGSNDFLQLMIHAHQEAGPVGELAAPGYDEEEEDEMAMNGATPSTEHKHQSRKHGLTNDEIVANAIFFFIAGYETTATALSWCAYSLATNPHVQTKLMEEVDSVVGADNEVKYEDLSQMPYLDKVWCEVMRLNSPAERTDRGCSRDITLSNGCTLEKGDNIVIPIYVIHLDPQNYPDPFKFDPERFSSEERSKRNPYTYLPFGIGPRNCIGQRFAVMEAKFALVKMLQKFRFINSPTTPSNLNPFDYKYTTNAITYPIDGIRLFVERR